MAPCMLFLQWGYPSLFSCRFTRCVFSTAPGQYSPLGTEKVWLLAIAC
jgi:hypothetical protein